MKQTELKLILIALLVVTSHALTTFTERFSSNKVVTNSGVATYESHQSSRTYPLGELVAGTKLKFVLDIPSYGSAGTKLGDHTMVLRTGSALDAVDFSIFSATLCS